MRFAPDLLEKRSINECICGKSSKRVTVNSRLMRRGIWLVSLSVAALLLLTAVYGTDAILPRVSVILWIYALLLAILAILTFSKLIKGHNIPCSLRAAVLTMF